MDCSSKVGVSSFSAPWCEKMVVWAVGGGGGHLLPRASFR